MAGKDNSPEIVRPGSADVLSVPEFDAYRARRIDWDHWERVMAANSDIPATLIARHMSRELGFPVAARTVSDHLARVRSR